MDVPVPDLKGTRAPVSSCPSLIAHVLVQTTFIPPGPTGWSPWQHARDGQRCQGNRGQHSGRPGPGLRLAAECGQDHGGGDRVRAHRDQPAGRADVGPRRTWCHHGQPHAAAVVAVQVAGARRRDDHDDGAGERQQQRGPGGDAGWHPSACPDDERDDQARQPDRITQPQAQFRGGYRPGRRGARPGQTPGLLAWPAPGWLRAFHPPAEHNGPQQPVGQHGHRDQAEQPDQRAGHVTVRGAGPQPVGSSRSNQDSQAPTGAAAPTSGPGAWSRSWPAG